MIRRFATRLPVTDPFLALLTALLWGAPAGICAAAAFHVPPLSAFRDAPIAPELVVLPAGRFIMGSSEAETAREGRASGPAASERPAHVEVIAGAFAIGRYPVTVAEFDTFVKATRRDVFNGCQVDQGGTWRLDLASSYLHPGFAQGPDSPTVCVTWGDADAYVRWLSATTGHRYRLPRESEFEYAARAGTTTARWWGDGQADLCVHANGADKSFDRAYPGDDKVNRRCDDGYAATNPVSHFPANPWGLHDMIGNVWEWLADCFRETYAAPEPPAGEACARRAIRGGSWHNYPNVLRAASRFALPPTMRASSTGFRVVREADSVAPSAGSLGSTP